MSFYDILSNCSKQFLEEILLKGECSIESVLYEKNYIGLIIVSVALVAFINIELLLKNKFIKKEENKDASGN